MFNLLVFVTSKLQYAMMSMATPLSVILKAVLGCLANYSRYKVGGILIDTVQKHLKT